jgi:uncharacterized membrane protein YhiD involved in acid resistance
VPQERLSDIPRQRFIGAGAILRKGSLVRGLTTAATLWFVTVFGLCFGGGQLVLGLAVLALGVLVLGGLKRLESRWKQDRHATLSLTVDASGPTEDELTIRLQAIGYEIRPWTVVFVDQGRQRQLSAEVRWRARPQEAHSSHAGGSPGQFKARVSTSRWKIPSSMESKISMRSLLLIPVSLTPY